MQDRYFSRTGPQLREKFLALQVLIPLVDSVSSAIMRRRRTRLCNCGRRSDHQQQHWMKQRFHGNSSDYFTHCITLTFSGWLGCRAYQSAFCGGRAYVVCAIFTTFTLGTHSTTVEFHQAMYDGRNAPLSNLSSAIFRCQLDV